MSVDSSLVARRDALPQPSELEVATKALTGVTVVFDADFRLTDWGGGWVPVTVDGDASGFEYYACPIDEAEDLPAEARLHGDYLLSFVARGPLSAQVVSLLQRVMAARWGAAGLIAGEVIPPADMARDAAPIEGMDPDLAATMTGTPAQRAAATQRYVAKFYPPLPSNRYSKTKEFLKQVAVPILIFVALSGFYLWSQIQ